LSRPRRPSARRGSTRSLSLRTRIWTRFKSRSSFAPCRSLPAARSRARRRKSDTLVAPGSRDRQADLLPVKPSRQRPHHRRPPRPHQPRRRLSLRSARRRRPPSRQRPHHRPPPRPPSQPRRPLRLLHRRLRRLLAGVLPRRPARDRRSARRAAFIFDACQQSSHVMRSSDLFGAGSCGPGQGAHTRRPYKARNLHSSGLPCSRS